MKFKFGVKVEPKKKNGSKIKEEFVNSAKVYRKLCSLYIYLAK